MITEEDLQTNPKMAALVQRALARDNGSFIIKGATDLINSTVKRNKYNNNKIDLGRGQFDSKTEAKHEKEYHYSKIAGEIKDYEIQVRFPLEVNGFLICTYIADFLITHNDGTQEIADSKGFKTKEFKIKWKLLQAIHGNKYTYRLLSVNEGVLQ